MSDEKKSIEFDGLEIPIQKVKPRRTGKDLQAIADDLGISPFEILLHAAAGNYEQLGYSAPTIERMTPDGDKYLENILPCSLRIAAAKEAAQYLHPKKRAIEHSGNADEPINLNFEGSILDLIKFARSKT